MLRYSIMFNYVQSLPWICPDHISYGGCPKYLFPDSPQSLSQSRSNRGTTVSNRGRGLFFVDQIIYIKYKLYYIRNRDKNLMPILCNIIVFLLNLKQLLLLLLLLVLLVLL